MLKFTRTHQDFLLFATSSKTSSTLGPRTSATLQAGHHTWLISGTYQCLSESKYTDCTSWTTTLSLTTSTTETLSPTASTRGGGSCQRYVICRKRLTRKLHRSTMERIISTSVQSRAFRALHVQHIHATCGWYAESPVNGIIKLEQRMRLSWPSGE